MTPGDRELGDAVVRRRLKLSMSQEDLSERAGVARDTIQALELGRRTNFRPRTKRKLDKALQWVEGEGIEAIEAGRDPIDNTAQVVVDPMAAAVVELFTASIGRLGQRADEYGRSVGDASVGARWMTEVLELRDRAAELARQASGEVRQRYA